MAKHSILKKQNLITVVIILWSIFIKQTRKTPIWQLAVIDDVALCGGNNIIMLLSMIFIFKPNFTKNKAREKFVNEKAKLGVDKSDARLLAHN